MAAIGAAAVLAAPISGAWAKTDPATWVKRIVVELDAINRRQAWAPVGEARPGTLATGGEARLEFPLAAGDDYRFVVVCEPLCGAGSCSIRRAPASASRACWSTCPLSRRRRRRRAPMCSESR
jgi:hypothetical protein